MKATAKIGLKYAFTGLLKSALAVAVIALALRHYAGPVHWLAHPVAAGAGVFLMMNRSMWRAIQSAHNAGEVDRRVVAQIDHEEEEHAHDGARSSWFNPEAGRRGVTSGRASRAKADTVATAARA